MKTRQKIGMLGVGYMKGGGVFVSFPDSIYDFVNSELTGERHHILRLQPDDAEFLSKALAKEIRSIRRKGGAK